MDDVARREPGDRREPGVEEGAFVVVDDLGRVAGSFALFVPLFLVVELCGAPVVRFLDRPVRQTDVIRLAHAPFLDNICLERKRPHDAMQFLKSVH